MSLASYSDLVTAVAEWLAREQDATLIARIPDFIALCEAKLNRELQHPRMETRSTAMFAMTNDEPQFISLPTDFQSMRRIRLTSISGKPQVEYKSQVQLDEYRTSIGDVRGKPCYFTVFGNEIEFAPSPDQAYTIEMVYRAYIPALTASKTTNWLLTLAPDLYLYGALLESAPYIKEDGRIQVWATGFSTCLDSLNQHGRNLQFGAQPLIISVSGYTP